MLIFRVCTVMRMYFDELEIYLMEVYYTPVSYTHLGIVSTEAYIDVSNVMYLKDGKATRIGFEVKDGKKVRVAKATGEVID